MNCREVQRLLHPYSDGELDLVRHVEIEAHLTQCPQCADQEKHLRSLRAALASPSLYHHAPAALRSRLRLSPAPVPRRRLALRRVAVAAALFLLLGAAAMLVFGTKTSIDERLAERVVVGHVRSLQVDHLTDVASSDQHTVKPWFRGKLDFSPQVIDLAAQGFALSGGRLDYLTDRPVAALVYYRRLHAINLFTWPAGNDDEKAVRRFARQGFHLRSWQRSGMTYWAVSDLNNEEFDEFVRHFQEQTP